MAGRILNRRELRQQSDAAESAESADVDEVTDEAEDEDEEAGSDEEAAEGSEADGDDEAPPAKKAKAKAKAKPKAVRKPRKPKAVPRMRARWGVFDGSMKQIAVFDYKDRAAADAKVAELLATRKTGSFFLQMVKEPMPEDAPAAAAT
jgi:hypothetical protein